MSLRAHLFICTHRRETGSSCAARGSVELREQVKNACRKLGKDAVRVNSAGCLGRCEEGIAAVMYPSGEWKTHLHATDVETLTQWVESTLQPENPS